MSETRPVYIACASGTNAQTDVLVAPHGSLVRLLGHPQMDFTGKDAYALSKAILAAIDPEERPYPSADEKPLKNGLVGAHKASGALIFSRELLMHYQCSLCNGWWSIGDGRSYGGYFCPHCGHWLEVAR